MSTWIDVNYKCYNCGATDTDRILPGRTPSPVANCWKCGSGRGRDVAEMIEGRLGMHVVVDESTAPSRIARSAN